MLFTYKDGKWSVGDSRYSYGYFISQLWKSQKFNFIYVGF